MTEEPTAAKVAKKLARAFSLVSNASYIACVSDSRELTKDEIALLRDYLPDAEDDLQDVIVALVGHTLAEVE